MIHGLRFDRASVRIEKGKTAPVFVHSYLEKNRSDFDVIFRCIDEMLGDLVFIENNNEPFVSADEKYWSLALETLPDKRALWESVEWATIPATELQKFGNWVSDD